jgi:centractin
VQLGPERFRAAEILFNPEIIGLEDAGVHQVVVDSINRVDMDLRKSLYSNIVLSGGTTLCTGASNLGRASFVFLIGAGYGDRLLNEVKRMKDGKIKIYAPPERKYSTWIGGSILAGLNTFKKVSFLTLLPCFYLKSSLDVGICGGVSRRSRDHPQEIWILNFGSLLPTYVHRNA